MSRSRLNWIVICEVPWPLIEVIWSMPAIVENCFSSTVATAEAIVSGLAPGSCALTWIVGKSTFGSVETGSSRYAAKPKMRMPAMTSTGMTGRRTNGSEIFPPPPKCSLAGLAGGADLDARARRKAQRAARDDALPLRDALDYRLLALASFDVDAAQLRGVVLLDHVDVLAAGAGLQRARRDQDRLVLLVEPHADVDELPGPERRVLVVELAAQPDRAGARVDRVVDEDQPPLGGRLGFAGDRDLDRERSGAHVLAQRRQRLLGHREIHVNRLDLIQHHQSVHVVR